jgi:filamentous hemagglutinin family protein
MGLVLANAPSALANPEGAQVVAGSATVQGQGTAVVTVNQSSQKTVLNWDSFSIKEGELTKFLQPNPQAIALNRVIGGDPSLIYGTLSANGRLILINPNGLMIGPSGTINANSFIASTAGISDENFLAGNLTFDITGNPNARIINEGTVTAGDAGLVAFVAPSVKNSGLIEAKIGTVTLGAASKFTLDFYGDELVSFPIDAEVVQAPHGAKALVEAGGRIEGQNIVLSARAARSVINDVIIADGELIARSASVVDGKIRLGPDPRDVERSARERRPQPEFAIVDTEALTSAPAAASSGGRIKVDGGDNGRVMIAGLVDANGASGGTINITGEQAHITGSVLAEGLEGDGGTIDISGARFVSFGGLLSVDGASGGVIGASSIDGDFSLGGKATARGRAGAGGTIDVAVAGESWEFGGSLLDVSGATDGGSIRSVIGEKLVSSAAYRARGEAGQGGRIDASATSMFLLSSTFDASGDTNGGRVRLGGEFQGGKTFAGDELPNAQSVSVNDGVVIDVSSRGAMGNGGTAVVWSDKKTLYFGYTDARPGLVAGTGGLVETSGLEQLIWRGSVDTARNGARGGTLLLDPRNITISEGNFDPLQLILGALFEWQPLSGGVGLGQLGSAVSLDGTRLAVGASRDGGINGTCTDCGAVYLFTFADADFAGGQLAGRMGVGYSGQRNIDLTNLLDGGDFFGSAVALDGTHLAVGAFGDDGASDDCIQCGAVYLFEFSDDAFSSAALESRVGSGYSGTKDINLSALLETGDVFGRSVSLDASRLAVGADGDDGANDACADCGAAFLFSFGTAVADGELEGRIGAGYLGPKDIDLSSQLEAGQSFGFSLSLDGINLAIGARLDNGEENTCVACGAVYLLSFDDLAFAGGAVEGRIGSGYTDAKDVDLTGIISPADTFGYSLALEDNLLIVGVPGDRGFANNCANCGAVFTFSFLDTAFGSGSLQSRIGHGYAGLSDANLVGILGVGDSFGRSVALDGSRFAVGAPLDDGAANTCVNCGAVYLFAAGGPSSPILPLGRIGVGYTGDNNLNLQVTGQELDVGDWFGASVSLDGLRAAIGAPHDDGAANGCADCGAVYLFRFADSYFSGASLEARIGAGYIGGKNINLAGVLEPPSPTGPTLTGDLFGTSVSLDGSRLAVGAPGDRSAACVSACGAVYLFTFADADFLGGELVARIGKGYFGSKDIHLDSILQFGHSVSLDGTRLAVGDPRDGSIADACGNCGAVYLFQFADAEFSSGSLEARLGFGYSGPKDIDLTGVLDPSGATYGDAYGFSVALDGVQLAVGAAWDSGANDDCLQCGAVLLFTFADMAFGGGVHRATIGDGYTGPNDLNLDGLLNPTSAFNGDEFGDSVSLENGRLAVGAPYDDGKQSSCAFCGAVYLFSFAGGDFSGGTLDGRLGGGYDGPGDVDLTGVLSDSDFFGQSVSLNENRLAVGSRNDDGAFGQCSDCGASYLFNFSPALIHSAFSSRLSAAVTVLPDTLTSILDSGTNVILQANNDIIVLDDLIVHNPSGDGGDLILQAGRSIVIESSIATDDGDLILVANELLSAGVVDSERQAGSAEIAMLDGATINAGSGTVTVRIASGEGKTHSDSGHITLRSISAGILLVENLGPSGGDIIVEGALTTSGIGDSIVLATTTGRFVNNAGTDALNPGSGRFLVYTPDWSQDVRGGLTGANLYNRSYTGHPPSSITESGSLFIHELQPILTVAAQDLSRVYGSADPALAFSVSGLINGDPAAYAFTGAPELTTAHTETSDAGLYTNGIVASIGNLASSVGYGFVFVPGDLTITPAPLTVTAQDAEKTFGDVLTFDGTEFDVDGLLFDQTIGAVTLNSAGSEATAAAGDYAIVVSNAMNGTFNPTNYAIVYVDGVLTVTPAFEGDSANGVLAALGSAGGPCGFGMFMGDDFACHFTGADNEDEEEDNPFPTINPALLVPAPP